MKQISLLILAIAFTVNVFADIVELADAKTIAVNAYYQKLNLYHQPVSPGEVIISESFEITRDGEPVYYVFNMENYGYIIIPAEDALQPVQAYSFTKPYDPVDQPDNFRGWLDSRAGAVVFAREQKIEATDEIKAGWDALRDISLLPLAGGGKSVEPLMTQTWNQDWPENYYMPLDPDGPGGRCLVGCVATAMAQIMHYWRYPLQGNGVKTHSYGPYPAITVNYEDTWYDWDGMLDNSDQQVNLAMAEISMHAAVSVNMQWGPNSSGAYSIDVPPAIKYYFGYNNGCYLLERGSMAWTNWKNVIKTDLDDLIPVYFSGTNAQSEGHAFVCDGYNDDDMFHFNFGWSGSGNGWFDISSPSGYEWYYNQSVIRFLYPADANYPYGCTPGYERTTLVGSFEDGSGPQENYDPDASCSWLINPQTAQDSVETVKLQFITLDTGPDDVITIYDGPTTNDPVLGEYSGTTTPSGWIYATGNKMLVTFEANGDATTGSGWKVQYSSELPDYCSSSPLELTEPSGTLEDGSGTFWYKNNTNCMWKIAPDYASGVTLTFTSFDTEAVEDYLKVYDASNNQLMGEFSGNTLPDPIHVESGELFLIWKTSGAITRPGWEAYWEADNVGIKEGTGNLSPLMIYPNPAGEVLTISFSADNACGFQVRLTSVTGETIYEEQVKADGGSYTGTINLAGFARGVYFLSITGEKATINRKVVIK